MDNSGSVQDKVVFMDRVGLLWIQWVCNGNSGSVLDIAGL